MLLPGCASTRSLSKGAAGGQAPYVVLYVLLSFFLLCSLALVLIIFIIQRERKKEIIEEKKELDTHQKTLPFPPIPEEMPEYDTISTFNDTIPEENPANTIYSTVHIAPKVTEPYSLPMLSDTPTASIYNNVM